MSDVVPSSDSLTDTPSSSELLSAAQFGEWLASQRESVLQMMEHRVGDALRRKLDLDDLLQDAAARALSILAKQPVAANNPLSWFLTIVDHQILDAHRYHFAAQKRDAKREVSSDAGGGNLDGSGAAPGLIELLVASITSPSRAFSRNLQMERMQTALSELPEEAQNAIRWKYLDGLPSQEIAQRLQKSDGAVRVLLTRSLKKLQASLQDVAPTRLKPEGGS